MVRVLVEEKPVSPFYLGYNGDFRVRGQPWGKLQVIRVSTRLAKVLMLSPISILRCPLDAIYPILSGKSRWSYAKSVSRFHKSAEFLSDLIPHLLYFRAKFAQMITAPSSSRCGSWSKRSPGARPTRPTTASFGSEVSPEGNYKSSEFQPDWPRS